MTLGHYCTLADVARVVAKEKGTEQVRVVVMYDNAASHRTPESDARPPARQNKVNIPVRVHLSHAQSEWAPFLNRVMRELELEDIDGVYEDVDGAPVVRIASLLNGGLYFARPTEV